MDLTDYGKPKRTIHQKDSAAGPERMQAVTQSPELTGEALRFLVMLDGHVALTGDVPKEKRQVLFAHWRGRGGKAGGGIERNKIVFPRQSEAACFVL